MDDANTPQNAAPPFNGKPWQHRRHRFGGTLVGLFVILMGVLFLLSNLGFVYIDQLWRYWPAVMIVWGLSRLINSRYGHGRLWGGMIAAAGGLLLAASLGYIHGPVWNYIWPLFIIWAGFNMLFGARWRRRRWESWHDRDWQAGTPPAATGSFDHLSEVAVFGGIRKRIDSQSFEGGEIRAVFGGVELDLRPAAIVKEEIQIEADAVFGGVELLVPQTWKVRVEGQGVFGGYEDKTQHAPEEAQGPRVLITGNAVFGGVTVKN